MASPILLSTWSFGQPANAHAWPALLDPRRGSLDAVEQACRYAEADESNMTVGRGGYPDASGQISLDASIMLSPARRGAVCHVKRFVHAISIARLVMEQTPHILLAGEGAEQLARAAGMIESDLATPASQAAYAKWLAQRQAPRANIEELRPGSHDTIGSLALDPAGILAGACSTSGLAWKLPGRVGDSPLIGAGLYVDPQHGAAVATGTGELMIGICAAFLAVESLRRGDDPLPAAAAVIRRIADTYTLEDRHQAALILLRPDGRWASAALRKGFRVAVKSEEIDRLAEPDFTLIP